MPAHSLLTPLLLLTVLLLISPFPTPCRCVSPPPQDLHAVDVDLDPCDLLSAPPPLPVVPPASRIDVYVHNMLRSVPIDHASNAFFSPAAGADPDATSRYARRVRAVLDAVHRELLSTGRSTNAPSYTLPGWAVSHPAAAAAMFPSTRAIQRFLDLLLPRTLSGSMCAHPSTPTADMPGFAGMLLSFQSVTSQAAVDNLQGLQLFGDGELRAAAVQFKSAWDNRTPACIEDGVSATYRYNLGLTYLQLAIQGMDNAGATDADVAAYFTDATVHLEQAVVAPHGRSARHLYSLAYAYEATGRLSDALNTYQAAIAAAAENDPQFAGHAYHRVLALTGSRVPLVLMELTTPFFIHTTDDRVDSKMGATLIRERHWDPPAAQIFGEVLTQLCASDSDTLVVDVGGNIGFFTLLGTKLGCRVLSVEPLPKLRRQLLQNVVLGEVEDRVTVLPAVMSARGTAATAKRLIGLTEGNTFALAHALSTSSTSELLSTADDVSVPVTFYPYGCIACSHVNGNYTRAGGDGSTTADGTPTPQPQGVSLAAETVRVAAVRLDDAVGALSTQPQSSSPALIKVDVEGCELDALQSSLSVLQRRPFDAVVEVCPGAWSRCNTDLPLALTVFGVFIDAGYTFEMFELSPRAASLVPKTVMDRLVAPANNPHIPGLQHLYLSSVHDVSAFFGPQVGDFAACSQLWFRPPHKVARKE